jgi:hypothetical protein
VAMSAEHRRRRVSELVQERGSVRVADLADELGVAPVTARRDVAQLAALGLVDHGYGIASWPDQVPPYLPVAVRHLASLGHSRIVLAAHRSATDAGIRAGYLSALDVSALGEPPVPVIDTFSLRSNPTGFESAVEQLLAAVRGHAVTAALVHNDVDAIMLVHRLRALGVRVPGTFRLWRTTTKWPTPPIHRSRRCSHPSGRSAGQRRGCCSAGWTRPGGTARGGHCGGRLICCHACGFGTRASTGWNDLVAVPKLRR